MSQVIFEIKALGLGNIASRGSKSGYGIEEAVKSAIVKKMNQTADLVQAAFQSNIPYRSGALRNSIRVTPAEEKSPVAKVYILDGVHYSPSKEKAAIHATKSKSQTDGNREEIATNQKQLEAFRLKAVKEYEKRLEKEISARQAAHKQDKPRTRKRITMNAGAQALSNIELAFLMESGGSLSSGKRGKGIKLGTNTFGEEPRSNAEAIRKLETGFLDKSFKQHVEEKSIERIATKKKTLERKKTIPPGMSALKEQIRKDKVEIRYTMKTIGEHKLKIKLAPNETREDRLKILELQDNLTDQYKRLSDYKNSMQNSISEMETKIATAGLLTPVEKAAHAAKLDADFEKKYSMKKVKAQIKKELLAPYKQHPGSDKIHTKSSSPFHRVSGSEPMSPFSTAPGPRTATKNWMEDAIALASPEITKVMDGFGIELDKSVLQIFKDLSSVKAGYLNEKKPAGVNITGQAARRSVSQGMGLK